jgi:hypothetical protein
MPPSGSLFHLLVIIYAHVQSHIALFFAVKERAS